MKFTSADYDAITRAVERAEEKTTAELVVVIRPYSGNYRDVAYLFGAGAAWLMLIFILFSSWTIEPYTIPLEIIPFFLVPALLLMATPLRRWLTSARRRRRQVKAAARDAFFNEGVWNTRAHTGVLIYLSALERRVEVLAERDVRALVPVAEWNAFVESIRRVWSKNATASALAGEIDEFGALLGRYLPATADNPNEIPNRPRGRHRGQKRKESGRSEVAAR